jgi:hypothetical protein
MVAHLHGRDRTTSSLQACKQDGDAVWDGNNGVRPVRSGALYGTLFSLSMGENARILS